MGVSTLDRIIHIIALTIIVSFCYLHSLNGVFVFDDNEAIVNNKDVSLSCNLISLLSHDFWGSEIASTTSHKSFRPITTLSFCLNTIYSGELDPRDFHVVNIALYLISVILLYTVSIKCSSNIFLYTM